MIPAVHAASTQYVITKVTEVGTATGFTQVGSGSLNDAGTGAFVGTTGGVNGVYATEGTGAAPRRFEWSLGVV